MGRREYNNENLQEFESSRKEYFCQMQEFYPQSDNEIVVPLSEYQDPGEEFNESEIAETGIKKPKKKNRAKLLRKMSYLVTASVSAVVIGQTVELPENKLPEEKVEEKDHDFQWPHVEGFSSSNQEEKTDMSVPVKEEPDPEVELVIQNRYPRLDMEGYDAWGYANGGVMPVQKNGLWGLLDYTGREVLEPSYSQFISSPNDHGYSVLADDSGYDVIDTSGQIVLEFGEDTYDVSVGESNVVLVKRDREMEDGSFGVRYTYMLVNGEVIHDTGWLDDNYFNVAGAFHEGKAYLYICKEPDLSAVLYEVTLDGIREIDRERNDQEEHEIHYEQDLYATNGIGGANGGGGVFAPTYAPIGALSQGFYLAEVPGGGGGWYLFHPETLQATGRSIGVEDASFPWGYADAVSVLSYKDNGTYLFNYGTYGVAEIYDDFGGSKVKDVLFDYTDVNEMGEYYQNIIASYDTITPDNFPYLVVEHGESSFYIDHSGNVVSDTYDAATSFNDRGYAMVQKGTTAYVVNRQFEKLETVNDVQTIVFNDDMFTVKYLDGRKENWCFVE